MAELASKLSDLQGQHEAAVLTMNRAVASIRAGVVESNMARIERTLGRVVDHLAGASQSAPASPAAAPITTIA
jgi:hypothetical protein